MTDSRPPDINQSKFLDRALDSIHPLVLSFIGAILGVAIALIAVLQLGGLAVPVNNYLTSQLQAPLKQLDLSVDKLQSIISRLDGVEVRAERSEKRIQELEKIQDEQSRDIRKIKGRLGI